MSRRDLMLETSPPNTDMYLPPQSGPKHWLVNDLREEIVNLYSQTQKGLASTSTNSTKTEKMEPNKQLLEGIHSTKQETNDTSLELSGVQKDLCQSVELDPLITTSGHLSSLRQGHGVFTKEVTFSKERPTVIPATALSESDIARITPKQIYNLLQSMNGTTESINGQVIEGLASLRQNMAKVIEDNNLLNSELLKLHEENQQKNVTQAHLVSLLEKRELEIENLRKAIRHSEEMEGKKNDEIRTYLMKCDEIRSLSERTIRERDTVLDELKAKMSTTTADYRLLEAEADRTSSELIECKARLQTAESQVLALNSKLSALATTSETTLLRKDGEIDKLELEVSSLKGTIQSLQEERRNEMDLHNLQRQEAQERANRDMERVEKEKQELLVQLSNFNTENTALLLKKDEDMASLRDEYEALFGEHKVYKATMDSKVKLLEENLAQVNTTLEQLTVEKATLLSTLTAEMQTVREESKAAVQAAEADTELIQTRLAENLRDKDKQIKELKNNIIDLQTEITELRKNQEFLIQDGQSAQARLNTQLKNLCNRYAILQSQAETEIETHKDTVMKLEAELSLAKKVHDQYVADTDAQISILTEKLEQTNVDYTTIFNTKDDQLRELAAAFKQQEIHFEKLLADKDDKLARIADERDSLKQLKEKEVAQLQSQLELSQTERTAAEKSLEKVQIKLQSELDMVRTRSELIGKSSYEELERLQLEILTVKERSAKTEEEYVSQLKAKDEIIEKLQKEINDLKLELAGTTMDATVKIQELNGKIELLQEVHSTTDTTKTLDIKQLQQQLEQQRENFDKSIEHYRSQIAKLNADLADVNARYASSVEKREREILRLKQESKDEALMSANKIMDLTAELLGAKRRIEKEQSTIAEVVDKQAAEITELQERHKKEMIEKDEQIQRLQANISRLKIKHTEKITELKATVSALVAQNTYSDNTNDSNGSLLLANLNNSMTVSSLNPSVAIHSRQQSESYEPETTQSSYLEQRPNSSRHPYTGSFQGVILTPRMSGLASAPSFPTGSGVPVTPGSIGAL